MNLKIKMGSIEIDTTKRNIALSTPGVSVVMPGIHDLGVLIEADTDIAIYAEHDTKFLIYGKLTKNENVASVSILTYDITEKDATWYHGEMLTNNVVSYMCEKNCFIVTFIKEVIMEAISRVLDHYNQSKKEKS